MAVFGLQDKFDYSKPVELIKRLIKNHFNKNAVVLDFFAGSGTTAQAVLELNIEDEGKRRFILCTNNQNDICENITYARCEQIIKSYDYGKQSRTIIWSHKIKVSDFGKTDIPDEIKCIKKDNQGKYDKFVTEIKNGYFYVYGITIHKKMHGIPANLKYYRTDFVSKDEEFLSDALLSHIAEMIQLEHGVKLDGKQYIMVLSDEDADRLAKNWQDYPDVKALYISSDVLLTAEQNNLFQHVAMYIIPDHYFDFELREVGESW